MMSEIPEISRQLRSLVKSSGELVLSIQDSKVAPPRANEVLLKVEASPINPSDLALLLGYSDISKAEYSGTESDPIVTAPINPKLMPALAARINKSMTVGNEGAGLVIATGESDEAQALMGKTVAGLGAPMYNQYRTLKVHQCLEMHPGVSSKQAAACFVNPLTAMGMVETMRLEGFSALVHTAAASNLGQMLQKICLIDNVPLVNIVRKPEQEQILRAIGATYVCDSSKDTFPMDIQNAIVDTKAYVAFDATGGGRLTNDILAAMERAANAVAGASDHYGSTQHKQVYIYGGLERSDTMLKRNYGFQWGLGGWLLTPFLQKVGRERTAELRQRVANEVTTTFKSNFSREVSMAGALTAKALNAYSKQSTGQKYLINPSL
ncbi:MAG: NADH oxidase [Porticoccaceae bacterium]|nr:NADH oxidase [Porticoccaceae bacterium]